MMSAEGPSSSTATERGSVLWLLALILVPLVFVAAIAVNVSYSRLSREEMQAVADLAALSSSSVLCTSKDCYADAREAAIQTVRLSKLSGAPNDQLDLSIDPAIGPEQRVGDFQVTVERGRWWRSGMPGTGSTDPYFESFDRPSGPSWQSLYPGIPDFAASNAVKVSIERMSVPFFVSLGSSGSYDLKAEAVSLGGEVETVHAAPFALPVCAILNKAGDFSARANCSYNRIFTRTDRYCEAPGDSDQCGILPNRQHRVSSQGSCHGVTNQPDGLPDEPDLLCDYTESCGENDCPAGGPEPGDGPIDIIPDGAWDERDGWENTCAGGLHMRFAQLTDAFGVVGVPRDVLLAATEPEIRSVIFGAYDGLVETKLGDEFSILPGGFTQRETGDLITGLIAGSDWETNVQRIQTAEIFWPAQEWVNEFQLPDASGACGCADSSLSVYTDPPCNGTGYYVPKQIGFCNSVFGNNAAMNAFPRVGMPTACLLHLGSGANPMAMPIKQWWQAPIPIIADAEAGAAACGAVDPPVIPAHRWQVIGFMLLRVFDVDIGVDPPSKPNVSRAAIGIPDASGRECETFEAFPPEKWPFSLPAPDGGPNVPTRCNNLTGRTICSARFIASSEFSERSTPRLVE